MMELKDPIVPFDVDETLVVWGSPDHPDAIEFNNKGTMHKLVPHRNHIQELIDKKMDGFTIIVWSQRGNAWAKEVVMKLGLENYVDAVSGKPYEYYDDKASCEFMGPRRYIKPLLED